METFYRLKAYIENYVDTVYLSLSKNESDVNIILCANFNWQHVRESNPRLHLERVVS